MIARDKLNWAFSRAEQRINMACLTYDENELLEYVHEKFKPGSIFSLCEESEKGLAWVVISLSLTDIMKDKYDSYTYYVYVDALSNLGQLATEKLCLTHMLSTRNNQVEGWFHSKIIMPNPLLEHSKDVVFL